MSTTWLLDGYAEATPLTSIAPWTGSANVALIGADGQLSSTGGGSVRHPTVGNDMEISWVVGTSNRNDIELCVRIGGHYDHFGLARKATGYSLYKRISSITTELQFVTLAQNPGDVVALRIIGTALTAIHNGNVIASATVTEFPTVKYAGIAALSSRGSNYATSLYLSETFQEILSVNGGSNTVAVGATSTATVTMFGSAVNSGTLDGVALTSVSNTGFTVPGLVDETVTPRPGVRQLAMSDGTVTGLRNVTVTPPAGLTAVALSAVFLTGTTSIVYNFSPAAQAGDWIYFDPTKGTVGDDADYQSSFAGTQVMWHVSATTGIARSFNVITPGSTPVNLLGFLPNSGSPIFDGAYPTGNRP